jgi:hypothetical protein
MDYPMGLIVDPGAWYYYFNPLPGRYAQGISQTEDAQEVKHNEYPYQRDNG